MTRLLPINRLLLSALCVALLSAVLTVLPVGHDHEACAHDLSGLCVPDGDRIGKAEYEYVGGRPGTPGTPPPGHGDHREATLIGHANPGGFNADVVAHKGYAYLGSWGAGPEACPSQGVRTFDLSDPSAPALVSTFAAAADDPEVYGSWTEKVIVRSVRTRDFRGDLAAVSFQSCQGAEGFRGFGVYDVTDPAHPRKLALVATDARSNGSHEIWLETRGGRAYVYTAIILNEFLTSPDGVTPGEPDFQVWDVSAPTTPTRVGGWGAWAELGVPPVSQVDGVQRVNFVHSLQQDRTTLYVSYWDLGTVMLDMRDPRAPRYLGRTSFAPHEEGNAHSSWTARGGGVLVQTDEDFSPTGTEQTEQAWGYTRIYDARKRADPRQIATFELPTTRQDPPPDPGFYTVHDPKIVGNTLYLSYYAEGVVSVDIRNPAEPRMTGQFKPPATADPFGFFAGGEPIVNVWGVFVTDDGYVLASDINSGLYVVSFDR